MDIVIESVKRIEGLLEQSGCSDAGVLLDVDPRAVICQFERGACMSATFGGKSTDFATYDPLRARTKVSFMFGASLDTLPTRGAACAIINVVLGFLCMSRVLRACPESCHASCREQIARELSGKSVFIIGSMGIQDLSCHRTEKPSDAEIILINGEGIVSEEAGDIIGKYNRSKQIVCVSPSTAGIARLHEIKHYCPFGRS